MIVKGALENEADALIEAEGCTIKHSTPGLPEMNGPTERSGGDGSMVYKSSPKRYRPYPEPMARSSFHGRILR
jgi:transposase InsO family protein